MKCAIRGCSNNASYIFCKSHFGMVSEHLRRDIDTLKKNRGSHNADALHQAMYDARLEVEAKEQR